MLPSLIVKMTSVCFSSLRMAVPCVLQLKGEEKKMATLNVLMIFITHMQNEQVIYTVDVADLSESHVHFVPSNYNKIFALQAAEK